MKPPAGRYILHVDDDIDDQNLLKEAIHEIDAGITVRNTKNGQEGLELMMQCLVHNDLPALIILDLNMPMMDGKVFLKEIKKTRALAEIPVVLFTTSSSDLDKLFAEKEGVELITKPSKHAAYIDAVKHILERTREGT